MCGWPQFISADFTFRSTVTTDIYTAVLMLKLVKQSPCTWNHFYSLGSMFVGSRIFPGSRGRNFVGRKFGIFYNNTIYIYSLYIRSWDVNSLARVAHKSHEYWSPKTMLIPQYLTRSIPLTTCRQFYNSDLYWRDK